jgi:26S proteasome regulatory subunit N6
LENQAKSKASLTAARSCANSIFVATSVQADIDMMSGILQAEEKDYKTA